MEPAPTTGRHVHTGRRGGMGVSWRRRIGIAAACAAVAWAPTGAAAPSGICIGPEVTFDAHAESVIRALANRFRASAGLRPLRARAALNRVARRHSLEMARRGSFAHSLRNGRFPWANGRTAAENLALAGTARQTHVVLTQSPPHRATLLGRRYRSFGVGALRTCTGQLLVTETFLG